MKVRCKILGIGERFPASDGSIIPLDVITEYLKSEEYERSIREKTMISSLTHRCRNLKSVFPDKAELSKTIGKNDSLLIVSGEAPTPTHIVTKLYINPEDGWLWGEMEILDENLFDDITKQNILRLKGLLRSGIKVHTSAVVIAWWNKQKNGTDLAAKIASISGVDVTFNSSWKDSHITEIIEDEETNTEEREFSIVDFDGAEGVVKAKCFSNINDFDTNSPRTSKIGNQFTFLKAKSFSCINPITVEVDDSVKQKEFSQAQVIERIRLNKLSPRIRFRRLILDYRQALKSQGGIEKVAPETLKIMKSLFSVDLLGILQELTPSIIVGKNLNALLGSSALGVEVRRAAQEMNIPLKLALQENKKQGFVSKVRYQKIQDAYQKFIHSILEYVFGTPTNQKLKEEEEDLDNGKEN